MKQSIGEILGEFGKLSIKQIGLLVDGGMTYEDAVAQNKIWYNRNLTNFSWSERGKSPILATQKERISEISNETDLDEWTYSDARLLIRSYAIQQNVHPDWTSPGLVDTNLSSSKTSAGVSYYAKIAQDLHRRLQARGH